MRKESKQEQTNTNKNIFKRFLSTIFSSKKRIGIAVVLLLILGFAGWKVFANKSETPQLQTATVEKGTIVSTVSASGQVLSSNTVGVTTQASGIVKLVYIADGDYVTRGDKLAEIELDLNGEQAQSQAYASYLSAKSGLASAQANEYTSQSDMFSKWDDFKTLAEGDTYKDTGSANRNLPEFHISQNDWLAAEIKYKNQQTELAKARASYNASWLSYVESRSTITAPSSGTINSLTIAEGMQLGTSLTSTGNRTNQRVATILTEGTPIASFNISEIDVSRIEVGQKATITIDAIVDKTFSGSVVSVDRVGSVTSGVTTYPILIRFDTNSNQVLPNMSASANIIIESKSDILVVSNSAIQTQGDQSIVKVLRGEVEQVVPVEIGISSDTHTEVISGLTVGDQVITGTSSVSGTSPQGSSPFGGGSGFRMMR